MNNLIKNIFRYSLKNKFSLMGLFILFSICMSSLLTLGLLSFNFTESYTNTVVNGNQHNIVINELYSSSLEGETNKEKMLAALQSDEAKAAGINARRFEGIQNQTSATEQSMVIKYEPKYPSQYDVNGKKYIPVLNENTLPTDNLQIYIQTGLPYLEANFLNEVKKFYHLPSSINFADISNFVLETYNQDLVGTIADLTPEQKRILEARQSILYFMAKGENSKTEYSNFLADIINKQDVATTNIAEIDPKQHETTKKEFKTFYDITAKDYNQPITTGYSIAFQTSQTSPVINFEDYNARICVVPPSLLRTKNKEVFSYQEFFSTINKGASTNNYNSNDTLYNLNTMNFTEFQEFYNNIDSKYKVSVGSIDYLIVGAGITPDFFYPIVSLQNVVVDFNNEFIMYANDNGYARTHYSFQSSPVESLILIKYTGNHPISYVINGLQNQLANKYLSFPANTQAVYAANDENNIFTPSPLRVNFISAMVTSINVITIILSLVLIIITLFIIVIILKKFISENIRTLYILVAQGYSKAKTSASLLFMPFIPCLLASIFSYLLAFFTQGNVFELFSSYWVLDISISSFNFGILLLVFVAFFLVVSIVIFSITFISLKQPVSSGITSQEAKLSVLSIWAKKPFAKANVVTKFRVSLIFGSFGKLIFLSIVLFLFGLTTSFVASTYTAFTTSLNQVKQANNSTLQIDLITPTRNGGQYYGLEFADVGKSLYADPNNINSIINTPSLIDNKSGYLKYYNGADKAQTPLFKDWANIMYISASDETNQKQQLRYLSNLYTWQFVSNINLNLKLSLFPIAINPWQDIVSPLLPTNQKNSSEGFIDVLNEEILMYNRIIPTSNKTYPKSTFKDLESKTKYFFIVDGKNDHNYVYENDTLYPVITTKELNLVNKPWSDFTTEEVKNALLNFGDVFTPQINIISLTPSTSGLKVELNEMIDYFTARSLFENLYGESTARSKKTTIKVFDGILNKERIFDIGSNKLFKFKLQLFPFSYSLLLSPAFLNFQIYVLSNPDFLDALYKIMYNSVVLNEDDEPYALINGKVLSTFNTRYDHINNINITGILPNSKYVHLYDQKMNLINDKLFNHNDANTYPLIANQYAKKLYNLNIGDTIQVFAENNVDRYNKNLIQPTINGADNANYDLYQKAYTKTFKIVDFSNSTKEPEFYTNITAAQKTIGLAYMNEQQQVVLDDTYFTSDLLNNLYPNHNNKQLTYSLINQYEKNNFGGFNGIFTGERLDGLTQSLSLYSPSGLYPGTTEFNQNSNIMYELLNNNLFKKENETSLKLISSALYLDKQQEAAFINHVTSLNKPGVDSATKKQFVNDVINELASIYRKTIYYSIVEKPNSVSTVVTTYSTLTSLITNIEVIVISLIAILSVIILIMTCWIIINNLMKLVVLLKVQGVSDWANALNVFSILFPTWGIAFILTIPFLYLVIYLFKEFVFLKMGLVLFASVNWWALILIFIGTGIILFGMLLIGIWNIKKINLVQSLKW